MIQFNTFIQKFSVRKLAQFAQPPVPMVTRFELPVMAMVHYVSPSVTNPWPSADMLFYQHNQKPLRVIHHTTLAETRGSPRLQAMDITGMMRKFRTANPRFRAAVDIEAMKREPRTIITHNYGLLQQRFKYQRNLFTFHNRWNNIFATLFQTVGLNTSSGYHQYLELQLPQKLVARSVLDKSLDGWTTRNMGIFNSYEMIFLHHLWAWLGERREDVSMIHKYIPNMQNVKLILREGERFTVLDMALLDEWRKPSSKIKKAYEEEKRLNPQVEPLKKGALSPNDLQKAFLRLLMSVMAVRNRDLPESLGDEEEIATVAPADAEPTDNAEGEVVDASKSATVDGEVTEQEAFKGYDEETDLRNFLAEVDKDLEALEITGQGDENAPIPESVDETEETTNVLSENDNIIPKVAGEVPHPDQTLQVPADTKEVEYFPVQPTQAFQHLLGRAADSGAITAAEYRRLQEASERFNELPAPLGREGTMGEFVVVPKHEIAIEESPSIPDQPTIIDKSMLKSSLLNWNERYSRQVMQRDIAGMVTNLQSAGVLINRYDVEEVEDITGSHYEYTIQVKPIEGVATTLSMKIPKVDDEGNFKINGVNYRMRMQRGDMPIRKISPDQVALTSYYGKVFTERSERRVNDWGKWIRNAIMAHGLNVSDTTVTNLVPGSAFDKSRKVPRTVSAIAMGFRQFTLMVDGKAFVCNFDMAKMPVARSSPKMALIGTHEETQAQLFVGFDDNLYIHDDAGIRAAPSIETILGLDARKAPVEFAELKVFGKMVPVGVVLGYLLGFENVIQLIKPQSLRIVPVGKRPNLVDDEWSFNFDDKKYVL